MNAEWKHDKNWITKSLSSQGEKNNNWTCFQRLKEATNTLWKHVFKFHPPWHEGLSGSPTFKPARQNCLREMKTKGKVTHRRRRRVKKEKQYADNRRMYENKSVTISVNTDFTSSHPGAPGSCQPCPPAQALPARVRGKATPACIWTNATPRLCLQQLLKLTHFSYFSKHAAKIW